MKKILATLLALTMVAVMGMSAFAAPSPVGEAITDEETGATAQKLSDGTVVVTIGDQVIVMTDIDGHWAEDDIIKAVMKCLMVGYPDGKFHPEDGLTVAMVYTVLARIADADIDTLGDDWAVNAGAWAEAEGIADGSELDAEVTRAQMVNFMAKAAAAEGDAVEWATSNGILIGDENGDLMLDSNLTRAQFATILVRYLGK